jgi:hypothetical protein
LPGRLYPTSCLNLHPPRSTGLGASIPFFHMSFSHLILWRTPSRDSHLSPAPVSSLPRPLYPTLCFNFLPSRNAFPYTFPDQLSRSPAVNGFVQSVWELIKLDHLLYVHLSSSHDTAYSSLSLQSRATHPPVGYCKPPVCAISIVPRPTRDPQHPAFPRLLNLLHVPRAHSVPAGRILSLDPLDVCFLFFSSYLSLNTRASVLCYLILTFQSHSWRKRSFDFLPRRQHLFRFNLILVTRTRYICALSTRPSGL